MRYICCVNTPDISLWSFPASLILSAAFVVGLWAADRYWGETRLCRTLSGTRAAVVLLLLCAALLTVEGVWAAGFYRSWPFILVMLLLTAALGLIVLRRFRKQPDAAFLLNHAGLFVILWGALFGAPDRTEARMLVRIGEAASLAYTKTGEIVPLPFEVRLDRFDIDYYDDGTTPRQFRSALQLGGHEAVTAVNDPARHGGYTFYQDGYDTRGGNYTVLLVVRDPWKWVVWCGIAMLAAGSLLLLLRKR